MNELHDQTSLSRRDFLKLGTIAGISLFALTTPVTAEAKRKKYRISYHVDYGKVSAKARKKFYKSTKTFKLKSPSRHGFTFAGWHTDKALTKRITKVKRGTKHNLDLYAKWNLAPYWTNHLNSVLPTIKQLDATIASHGGDSFVFITDVHVLVSQDKTKMKSAMVSPRLVNHVLTHSAVKKTIFGGDILTYRHALADAKADLQWFADTMACNNYYAIRGNHDTNRQNSKATTKNRVSEDFLYTKVFRGRGTTTPDAPTKFCYYLDNASQKVRYVFLDTGYHLDYVMSDAQVAWMQQRVLELESDWTVLVMAHQVITTFHITNPETDPRLNANGEKIVGGLDAIFDEIACTLAGVMCGHCHRDYHMASDKGYPIIATTTDSFDRARNFDIFYPVSTFGTIKEHSFDVVHLDTRDKKIYLTRIGRGARQRTFEYGVTSD